MFIAFHKNWNIAKFKVATEPKRNKIAASPLLACIEALWNASCFTFVARCVPWICISTSVSMAHLHMCATSWPYLHFRSISVRMDMSTSVCSGKCMQWLAVLWLYNNILNYMEKWCVECCRSLDWSIGENIGIQIAKLDRSNVPAAQAGGQAGGRADT